jgi:uncharacterized membrane protein
MKQHTAHLLRIFVTGLLAALPLAATVVIFWWTASFMIQWLGPTSSIGGVLVRVGLGVTGSEVVGYLIGIAVVGLLIFVLGVFVTLGLERGVSRFFQGLIQRIPLVGSVYDLVRRMVDIFAARDDGGLKSMSAVWCHFGGPPEAGIDRVAVLALLSTPEPVLIDGRPYVGVIVPTAPVPVGGGLLYLPQDWVRPAEMGIEAVTSIYVSMGITSAQHLPVAPAVLKPAAPLPGS